MLITSRVVIVEVKSIKITFEVQIHPLGFKHTGINQICPGSLCFHRWETAVKKWPYSDPSRCSLQSLVCQITWWTPPSLIRSSIALACLPPLDSVRTPPSPRTQTLCPTPSPFSSTPLPWTPPASASTRLLWGTQAARGSCRTWPRSTTTDTLASMSVPLSRRSSRSGTSVNARG